MTLKHRLAIAAAAASVAAATYLVFPPGLLRAQPKLPAPAARTPNTPKAASDMAKAALAFWTSLTPDQQKKAGYDLKDKERLNWHFIPKARNGLPLKEMTEPQRKLAHDFLASGLSPEGTKIADGIMSLEPILKEQEKGSNGPTRDPELYYFTVFGKPGESETWGWRVEGHHLSLNVLVVAGKEVAATPAFFGDNPARILSGPREGFRALGPEEDLGRALVKSLSDDQKKKAIYDATAPKDILTTNKVRVDPLKPDGIGYADLTEPQKKALTDLVDRYANHLRPELAAQDLAKIEKASWDKIYFAWAGSTEPGVGNPHYYRVQGPTFLIEYDNTQNNANHIHCVWRDFNNDFGEDLLKKHFEVDHH